MIDVDLTRKLESMVGFRNIAVHDYGALDVAILESIVRDHLVDLEQYVEAIKRRDGADDPNSRGMSRSLLKIAGKNSGSW